MIFISFGSIVIPIDLDTNESARMERHTSARLEKNLEAVLAWNSGDDVLMINLLSSPAFTIRTVAHNSVHKHISYLFGPLIPKR